MLCIFLFYVFYIVVVRIWIDVFFIICKGVWFVRNFGLRSWIRGIILELIVKLNLDKWKRKVIICLIRMNCGWNGNFEVYCLCIIIWMDFCSFKCEWFFNLLYSFFKSLLFICYIVLLFLFCFCDNEIVEDVVLYERKVFLLCGF